MSSNPVGERRCELCEGNQFESIGERDRHGRPLSTIICRGCGLVSHAVIPAETELADFYREEYRQAYQGSTTPSASRVVREWRRGKERFESLEPYLKSGDRVFEIGAGIGCNLKHFELAGFDSKGIEPGQGFAEFSRTALACRVRSLCLEDVDLSERFDMILMIHVLEHLPHPLSALTRVRELLHEGGRLYAEVPNLAGPHSAPHRLFHQAHIHNFTRQTLIAIANRAGLNARQVLSSDGERNLRVVFERKLDRSFSVDERCADAIISNVVRLSKWRYYGRIGYVREQLAKHVRNVMDSVLAKRRLNLIMAMCRKSPGQGYSVQGSVELANRTVPCAERGKIEHSSLGTIRRVANAK